MSAATHAGSGSKPLNTGRHPKVGTNALRFSADTPDGNALQIGVEPVHWACSWACWNILEFFGSCFSMKMVYLQEASSNGFKLESYWGFSVLKGGTLSHIFFLSLDENPHVYLKLQLGWFLRVQPIFRG